MLQLLHIAWKYQSLSVFISFWPQFVISEKHDLKFKMTTIVHLILCVN